MKTSGALARRMQSLLASFHPPNEPTALESQQILGVLQKSFRKKLDGRHPHPTTLPPKSSILYDSTVSHENASSQATSDHFGSLLSHPILNPLTNAHQKQDATRRFDRLMAESRVDVSCLISIMHQHVRDTQPGTPLSSRLDAWVRMADHASQEAFFTSKSAFMTAVDIVAKEDREGILWKWLALIYGRNFTSEKLTSRVLLAVEDMLVSKIMNLAIQRHKIWEAAEQFIQACRYRESSGRGNPSPRSQDADLPVAVMMRSAKRIVSAIVFHRGQHGIALDSFNQMIEFLPAWVSDPLSNRAFCTLYHPTQPSADPLYRMIYQPVMAEILTKMQRSARPATRKAVMTALLDASKVSLVAGKRSQASELLNFAIDNYQDFLPPRQLDAVEHQLYTSFSFATD